jgi:hypothetical protein
MTLFDFTVGAELRTNSLLFIAIISVTSCFPWYRKITNNKME